MSTISGLGGTHHALFGFPLKKNAATTIQPAAPQQPLQQTQGGWQAEQRPRGESLTPTGSAGPKSATDEFLDFMAMTPAEKLRYSILNEMGITEEQLAAMPPEERDKIEQKIAEMIQERLDIKANEDMYAPLKPATASNLSLLQQIQANEEKQLSVDIFS